MIGPLFVAAGVSAFDLVAGLLVGNLLAVASWTFLTVPVATGALTLFQLERICCRRLVTLYNLANGVMFCFLAGAMVTVNATAAGVPFDLRMPGLNDVYPNGPGWIVACVVMGGMITFVAAYGYRFVARVANIAAPWMTLVFVAFGLVGLQQLGIDSTEGLWSRLEAVVWTGALLPGQVKFTFWRAFFAWFWHGGAWHGGPLVSATPRSRMAWCRPRMFLGHYSPGRRRSSTRCSCGPTRPTRRSSQADGTRPAACWDPCVIVAG
jgi:amino acid transporter